MIERLKNEPALLATLVAALLALVVAFGLPLTDVQTASVMGLVFAVQALFIRSKVKPKRNL